ncbi:hypothetical protein [Photobacterium aquimaris]|uniref:DUF1311 domain-containing protein n=1 Tax=Photobacterium aquimaris TaxID=512643 RepID=A0A1Y6KZ83_9GAMM|nr:hypothetical protein [Photobacterium aquimaris]SMY17479.1 hypothetical protein PAQU9191_02786 [Photobacterium aquimaris]
MNKNVYIALFFLIVTFQTSQALADQENLRRCLDGNYPTLCEYHLLTATQKSQAKEAERQVNLKRCLDGNYPTLCNYSLLSEQEKQKAKQAESATLSKEKQNNAKGEVIRRTRTDSCYETSIVKPTPFMGNDGEIFKLNDGSLWEVKYEYEYLYAYYPDVIMCPSKNKLVVNGKSLNVEHVGGN